MSIKKLLEKIIKVKTKDKEEQKYASSFRRSAAATIDIWLVLFLRIAFMQTIGNLWLNSEILKFVQEFNEKFGTESIKNTPEHIDFVVHHRIFFYGLIFYAIVILVGTLYHALLNSSAWQATIGKRLMKIIVVKEPDESRISFQRSTAHYFLSVLPFAFIFYLMAYQIQHNLNFIQTITASELNVFFGIMFVLWLQIHVFTKKKTTAYDMICSTVFLNGRTACKFPWSKNFQ
jgi:uncharacterized RDD family membrane protein YckC